MNETNYDGMSLDELRQYVLTHREDDRAFQAYIDFSKATGRMISIDLNSDRTRRNFRSSNSKNSCC
ncbi:DUF6887 family protein [Synechocystis sp. PCC 7509]|uniref:DUF6887 family protein n=1 Tax=Synechocystis sp. PCC 7509 TaxID=927677 RepID=UPI0002ACFFE8|nr:hypothetical protein [Synechocystis sp. PCC 7509]